MQRFTPIISNGNPQAELRVVMLVDNNGEWVRASEVDAMRETHNEYYGALLKERDALEKTLASARRTIDTLNGNLADAQQRARESRHRSDAWYAVSDALSAAAPGWLDNPGSPLDLAVRTIQALADERDRLRAGYERALQHVAANTPSGAPDATDDSAGFPTVMDHFGLDARVEGGVLYVDMVVPAEMCSKDWAVRPPQDDRLDASRYTAGYRPQKDEAGHAMLADCGHVTINLAPGATVTVNSSDAVKLDGDVTFGGHVHTGQQPAPMDASRKAFLGVLVDIEAERKRQDEQWGGPAHDDEHSTQDWMAYVHHQFLRMHVRCNTPENRARWVKVAALAVAAIEAIDRAGTRSA